MIRGRKMVTIAHLVEKIVERRPFLEEAIARGIINYAALAEVLKPEIDKELKINAKQSAIMMAIRRLSEKLQGTFVGQAPVRFKESDITIRSDLFEVTFSKSSESAKCITKMYNLVDFEKGDLLTVTQGLHEITAISNKKYKNEILKILLNENVEKHIDSLSSLTVKIPESAVNTVGVFYVVTKALNWENISIVEIVSTFTELTFILREDDVSLAFNTVKNLIDQ
jgi:aspartokinase